MRRMRRMRRTTCALGGLTISMMLVFACVGEDPASPTVIVINDNDGSTPDGGGGNGEGGQSEGGGELSCTDKAKNGKETDVDCGGGACPKCDANRACVDNGDCATGICGKGFCQLANVPAWLPGPLLPYEGNTTKRGRSDFTLIHANGVIYAIGGWINDAD